MNEKLIFDLNWIQIQIAFFTIINKKKMKKYEKIKIWNETQNTSKNFKNDTNSILIDDQFRNNVSLISIQISVLLIILVGGTLAGATLPLGQTGQKAQS